MMTKGEALKALEDYFKSHRVKQVSLLNTRDCASYLELQCIKPYGIFIIDKITGEIDDNYGTFD